MIEEKDFPITFGVTTFAPTVESSFVTVIRPVAGVTVGGGRVGVQVPLVAGCAGGGAMFPSQGVSGLHLVVESHGLPLIGSVAGLAGFSKRSFVNIVFFMTAEAVHGRVLERGGGVAGFAVNLGVFAQEREAAFLVIEGGLSPGLFGVAGVAAGAFLAAVFVVFFVTAIAISGDAGEAIILMAGPAGDVRMFVSQGITGLAVVEADLFPGLLRMTTVTPLAGFSPVPIVFFMTAEAVHGRVLERGGDVAGFAVDLGVFAQEGESRGRVIEAGCMPRSGVMAIRAAGAFLAAVFVVFF
ncbi:MAG: hypothetical protein NNA21_08620, partial [Nitrospira sp.]|nr:hypothetical protein [Nitrospira sp.]